MKIWQNKDLKKSSLKKQVHLRNDRDEIHRLNLTFKDNSEINIDFTDFDLQILAKGIKPYYVKLREEVDEK